MTEQDYQPGNVGDLIALDVLPAGCAVEVETERNTLRVRAIDAHNNIYWWSEWMALPTSEPIQLRWEDLTAKKVEDDGGL